MGWMIEKAGFNSQQGQEILILSETSRLVLGPANFLFSGCWGLSLTGEEMQLGCEADHPPPAI